jgi:hypothetical protein
VSGGFEVLYEAITGEAPLLVEDRAEAMLVGITVGLRRLSRRPCEKCGKRRVVFTLTVLGFTHGMALCAICAQIR